VGRVKQHRHNRFQALPNCIAHPLEVGKDWESRLGNQHPVVLELGCGKAELSIGLARLYPVKNIIAIDLKSDRLCRGAELALDAGLKNIFFVRLNIHQLGEVFEENSISEIWLTFPDPFPRDRDEKHRLTHPDFLQQYQKVLQAGGKVHLKTDNDDLMAYSQEIMERYKILPDIYTSNLHNSPWEKGDAGIKTTFEQKFLKRNKNIHYLCFEIPKNLSFFKVKNIVQTS